MEIARDSRGMVEGQIAIEVMDSNGEHLLMASAKIEVTRKR